MPRSVRHLLGRMLRSDPAARPQDPVALAEELRETLQKVERRGIFDRALMPVIRGPEKKRRVLSARRALPIGLAVAAILLVAGLVNAVAPNRLRTLLGKERPITAIGVPIGVPEGSEIPPPSNPLPSATVEQRVTTQASPPGSPATLTSNVLETATSPSAAAAPANVVAIASPPATTVAREQAQPESPPLNAMNAPAASAQASPGESVEPAPPAEGPAPSPAAARKATRNFADQTIWRDAIAENANQPANAPADHSSSGKRDESSSTAAASPEGAKSPTAGNAIRKSSTRNKRVVSAGKPKHSLPPLRVGDSRAQFVGTNSKGNWVLRLPSGETVVTPPAPNPDSAPIEKHGRVRRVQGPPLEDHSADPPVMADPVHE